MKKKSNPPVVSGKISRPVIQKKPVKNDKINKIKSTDTKVPEQAPVNLLTQKEAELEKNEHYNSQGKIDPFKPLIQEKSEPRPAVKPGPVRILTPLEKIELSQIRLVAVIIMKNKRIAMVEEANGKGYEVRVGTYIGKKQGRVSEIKDSSIIIKELVEDYKGRPKENIQEIKLHKNDNGE